MSKPIIIAEVKTFSPDEFESPYTWDELLELAIGVGDWVSIHVDPRWKGHIKHLETARKNTNKPILAKGFHFCDEDLKRSFDAGADFALVVGRIPGDYHKKCLIEPYFREEFVSIPPEFKIVWNSRDVRALIEGTPPEPK